MGKVSTSTLYLMGCRKFDQFCCTLRGLLQTETFCPFCVKELTRRGRMPLRETAGWKLLENEFPHRATSRMLLIVPCRHVTDLDQFTEADWFDIGKLMSFCRQHLGIKSGGIMFRFGDPHLNVGTVEHLHINVIEPICGKEYRPPLAKELTEHRSDYDRMIRFRDELIEHGGYEWLFSEKGIRTTQPALV